MSLPLFTFCILLISSHVAGTSNWIGLYQDAHFSGLVQSLRDVETQTCYNLLCDGVSNVASSATWLGWTSTLSDSSLPIITFFMDKDCKGTSRGYKASGDEYPSDFAADGIDNKITSLIVFTRNVIDVDKTVTFCEGNAERGVLCTDMGTSHIGNSTLIHGNIT
ncbi:hypothetical protein PF005_g17877 [Phytophthora fragariae]|uniref:Pectate lyase n=1 Tax=Phytophthora fragariae TaxID=53985 RepID=A0A6A3SUD1_9STRA|nr:hypothetical protein PF003_g17047 [Phytophthora fragariae]KAE8929795.1 hypothetical protein PF009_g20098 [Phytophthora fragariae]KAE8988813.1 hypothetical protein PF011_g19023 [Phytophthora fragariae]KAE9087600.1 hypothetical protein PF007_g20317 [Phytophthora fragariae]KAE9087796.1 hypothetical protein PF010_g19602 [Phytophthora fragariae]